MPTILWIIYVVFMIWTTVKVIISIANARHKDKSVARIVGCCIAFIAAAIINYVTLASIWWIFQRQ